MTTLLALFLFAGLSAAAESPNDLIKITEVSGPRQVKVIRVAGAREQFLEPGETVAVGDELVTVKAQVVTLLAFDGSQWKVAPESRLKIEAHKPEQQSLFFWTFRILKGAMWGQVPKKEEAANAFRLKVATPNAALGIRGTEYLMDGDDKRSGIDVLEGVVWWGKSLGFKPGTYREVKAGEHGEIGPDGKILVYKSKGDKAALAVSYRLAAAPGTEEKKKVVTPAECAASGKGWRSEDGSKTGVCVNE